jgi:hypothetical protein
MLRREIDVVIPETGTSEKDTTTAKVWGEIKKSGIPRDNEATRGANGINRAGEPIQVELIQEGSGFLAIHHGFL